MVIGVVALIGFSIVVYFSKTFNLVLQTSLQVIINLIFLSVAIFCSLKFGDEFPFIKFGKIWPIFLGWLWVCFWPALEYWAHIGMPTFYDPTLWKTVWWNEWYGRWGVLLGLVAGGYGVKYLLDDNDSHW